ncbi:hypothetical protein [Pedobacter metabolipauper]|uniref:Inactive Receiver domain-containing protein n=1 Tax=Pedobacter metabolipauper TaxID=425513 RepID=A0A4R6SV15_9SPHI|nr:hypothetical protein [Pedobacter metabolipauper]TDQ08873.1 hypothetical protein ATK78_3393 [Pedobacter metabolipauper]
MDGAFILDDDNNPFSKKITHEIGVSPIEYVDLRTDKEIDDYVARIFAQNSIKKLIVPVSLGEGGNNELGLRIALHIRLSERIGEDNLIPIILISDSSLETLLINQSNRYALIAATEGSVLAPLDSTEIKAHLNFTTPISKSEFKNKVLDNVIIKGPETIGPHSMANEWGVIQLDKIANLGSLTASTPALQRKPSLYFKYLLSVNRSRTAASVADNVTSTPNLIPAAGKKILYIDDEGDKGWVQALTKIFNRATVVPLTGNNLSEANFMADIRAQINLEWDLILLDLRLLPWKEDIAGTVHPIGYYSGTKILAEIKTINEGAQVMIFTASNKAWNMRDLIDLGADGYYIKESPKYLIPDNLSLQNYESFKKQVEICFEKKYLRKFFTLKEQAISQTGNSDLSFMAYSQNSLNEFFKLLKLGMWETAFISLFLPIEQHTDALVTGTHGEVMDLTGTIIQMKVGTNYKMVHDEINYNFQIQTSNKKVRARRGLGKISFTMAFKFSKDNAYLIRIGQLVEKRNSISHGSATTIKLQDFEDLIAILKLFRTHS